VRFLSLPLEPCEELRSVFYFVNTFHTEGKSAFYFISEVPSGLDPWTGFLTVAMTLILRFGLLEEEVFFRLRSDVDVAPAPQNFILSSRRLRSFMVPLMGFWVFERIPSLL